MKVLYSSTTILTILHCIFLRTCNHSYKRNALIKFMNFTCKNMKIMKFVYHVLYYRIYFKLIFTHENYFNLKITYEIIYFILFYFYILKLFEIVHT